MLHGEFERDITHERHGDRRAGRRDPLVDPDQACASGGIGADHFDRDVDRVEAGGLVEPMTMARARAEPLRASYKSHALGQQRALWPVDALARFLAAVALHDVPAAIVGDAALDLDHGAAQVEARAEAPRGPCRWFFEHCGSSDCTRGATAARSM